MEIDNVIPSRVMLYLGDLGKRLPASERRHFLEYEMSPACQKISVEAMANDFGNCWVEPTGPVSRLVSARRLLDEEWTNVFGKRLYREIHPDDADIDKLIRVPSTNGREEFDTVISNLQKYLIDYIDESNFVQQQEKGSINKLGKFLEEHDIHVNLVPLHDLQDLRSASSAHAKGKKYDKLKSRLLTGDNAADIQRLMGEITGMLHELCGQLGGSGNRV
ncbi:MAG: hypothetical protein LIV26_09725 [Atopobium sp.]|nr:hypothetical protein [Atopobium sp.]